MQFKKIEEELSILILIGLKPIQLTDIGQNCQSSQNIVNEAGRKTLSNSKKDL
jgi:hypothetical protein